MEKCLAFSPKKRLDVSEALRHPYLSVGFAIPACWLWARVDVINYSRIMTSMTNPWPSRWTPAFSTLMLVSHFQKKS